MGDRLSQAVSSYPSSLNDNDGTLPSWFVLLYCAFVPSSTVLGLARNARNPETLNLQQETVLKM